MSHPCIGTDGPKQEPPLVLHQTDLIDHDFQLKASLSRVQHSLNIIEKKRFEVLQEIKNAKRPGEGPTGHPVSGAGTTSPGMPPPQTGNHSEAGADDLKKTDTGCTPNAVDAGGSGNQPRPAVRLVSSTVLGLNLAGASMPSGLNFIPPRPSVSCYI